MPGKCCSTKTIPAKDYTSFLGTGADFKTSASGREQVLAVNVAGETIAEIPVFDGGAYPASAIAVEETETAFISRKDFRIIVSITRKFRSSVGLCRRQAQASRRHH